MITIKMTTSGVDNELNPLAFKSARIEASHWLRRYILEKRGLILSKPKASLIAIKEDWVAVSSKSDFVEEFLAESFGGHKSILDRKISINFLSSGFYFQGENEIVNEGWCTNLIQYKELGA